MKKKVDYLTVLVKKEDKLVEIVIKKMEIMASILPAFIIIKLGTNPKTSYLIQPEDKLASNYKKTIYWKFLREGLYVIIDTEECGQI